MSILTIVFVILSFIIGLVFLIDCIRFQKEINNYVKYGAICGLLVLGIQLVVLIPSLDSFADGYVILLAALMVAIFVRTIIYTSMGIHCCLLLEIRPFWLLMRSQSETGEPREKFPFKQFLILASGTVALAIGYTFVLFTIFRPQMSETLKQLAESNLNADTLMGTDVKWATAALVFLAAISEEIVFRLGIQNYLAKQFKLAGNKYWIAIVLTAGFWSLAHANTLDPEWVKIAQVFPFGIALGFIFRKFGTEAAIVTHGAFNIIMMFLGADLIPT